MTHGNGICNFFRFFNTLSMSTGEDRDGRATLLGKEIMDYIDNALFYRVEMDSDFFEAVKEMIGTVPLVSARDRIARVIDSQLIDVFGINHPMRTQLEEFKRSVIGRPVTWSQMMADERNGGVLPNLDDRIRTVQTMSSSSKFNRLVIAAEIYNDIQGDPLDAACKMYAMSEVIEGIITGYRNAGDEVGVINSYLTAYKTLTSDDKWRRELFDAAVNDFNSALCRNSEGQDQFRFSTLEHIGSSIYDGLHDEYLREKLVKDVAARIALSSGRTRVDLHSIVHPFNFRVAKELENLGEKSQFLSARDFLHKLDLLKSKVSVDADEELSLV